MRDLAEAAETGEMPMMSGQKRVTVPIRGSVESLYSGIDPRTSGNKRGRTVAPWLLANSFGHSSKKRQKSAL